MGKQLGDIFDSTFLLIRHKHTPFIVSHLWSAEPFSIPHLLYKTGQLCSY